MQLALRGVALRPSAAAAAPGIVDTHASSRTGRRADVLAEACRWLLRWEAQPLPELLPLATQAACSVAALCEGPCAPNVTAVLQSAVPLCAARLLTKPHESLLRSPQAVARLRAALASLLTSLLSEVSGGGGAAAIGLAADRSAIGGDGGGVGGSAWRGRHALKLAHELTEPGGVLDAAALRWRLLSAHTAWLRQGRSAEEEEEGEEQDGAASGAGAAEGATAPDGSLRFEGFDADDSPRLHRLLPPGQPAHAHGAQLALLAEGCEVYALTQRLCALVPSLVSSIRPSDGTARLPVIGMASLSWREAVTSRANSYAISHAISDAHGAGAVWTRSRRERLAKALDFFEARVGRAELLLPHSALPAVPHPPSPGSARQPPLRPMACVVYFGIPEECAVLPHAIRAKAIDAPRADAYLSSSLAAMDGRGRGDRGDLKSGGGEPEHLVSFVRQCVLLAHQLGYQRSLAAYRIVVMLSSNIYPLMLVQGLLALPLGLSLLGAPQEVSSSAPPVPHARLPPLRAALPEPPALLRLAHLVLSIGLAALYLLRFGPSIIAHHEGLRSVPAKGAAPTRASGVTALGASAADSRRVAPFLLRLRLPVDIVLAALDGLREWREGYARLQDDVRHLAIRSDTAADELKPMGGRAGSTSSGTSADKSGSKSAVRHGRKLHALARWVFGLVSFRALLSDGTMLLLAAQAACALVAMLTLPPLAAALPLLSAIAIAPPLRRLMSALALALPALLQAASATLLSAWLVAMIGAHVLPRACGDAGGPWACTDGVECLMGVLDAVAHARGMREACTLAAASAGGAPPRDDALSVTNQAWTPAQEGWAAVDAGAGKLPALQLGMALVVPLLLLAWSYAAIRAAFAEISLAEIASPTSAGGGGAHARDGVGGLGSDHAAPVARRDFISGRKMPPNDVAAGGSGVGGGVGAAGSLGGLVGGGGAPLSNLSERSPWHYCAFVCRVLAMPEHSRSPAERHCARCLGLGGGTAWLPVPAAAAGAGLDSAQHGSHGIADHDELAAIERAVVPLALLRLK